MKKPADDLVIALGQCFWVGINGTTSDDPQTREIFSTFQPGGIVIFQRNVESIPQLIRLNTTLQKNSFIPLFIAVDQEGGVVERLHKIIGTIPPAMALTAAGGGRIIRKIHLAHGRILRALGFNVDFNPVFDLALQSADNGLGTRCFSSNPRVVTRCVNEVLQAYVSAGILGCGKHFPGLGDTDRDSHLSLPTVSRSWRTINREDLVPYKELLQKIPFIMINHALYPEVDEKMPASLSSKIVEDFLLNRWNYSGLSISDDLIMGAVSNMYNLTEAAERALLAGNHLFLVCRPEGMARVYRRLLQRAQRDAKLRNAIFRSSSRVLAFKYAHLPKDTAKYSIGAEIKKMARQSEIASQQAITKLNGSALKEVPSSCTVFLPQTKWISGDGDGLTQYLASRGCQASAHIYPLHIEESAAFNLAQDSKTDWNIVVTVNSTLHPGQQTLIRQLLEDGKKVAVIGGGYPRDSFPEDVRAAFSAYWTAPAGLKAAGMALFGERKATGKLPI